MTHAINYFSFVAGFHKLLHSVLYNRLNSSGDNSHSCITFRYLSSESIPAYEISLVLVEMQDNSFISVVYFKISEDFEHY